MRWRVPPPFPDGPGLWLCPAPPPIPRAPRRPLPHRGPHRGVRRPHRPVPPGAARAPAARDPGLRLRRHGGGVAGLRARRPRVGRRGLRGPGGPRGPRRRPHGRRPRAPHLRGLLPPGRAGPARPDGAAPLPVRRRLRDGGGVRARRADRRGAAGAPGPGALRPGRRPRQHVPLRVSGPLRMWCVCVCVCARARGAAVCRGLAQCGGVGLGDFSNIRISNNFFLPEKQKFLLENFFVRNFFCWKRSGVVRAIRNGRLWFWWL